MIWCVNTIHQPCPLISLMLQMDHNWFMHWHYHPSLPVYHAMMESYIDKNSNNYSLSVNMKMMQGQCVYCKNTWLYSHVYWHKCTDLARSPYWLSVYSMAEHLHGWSPALSVCRRQMRRAILTADSHLCWWLVYLSWIKAELGIVVWFLRFFSGMKVNKGYVLTWCAATKLPCFLPAVCLWPHLTGSLCS